MSSVLIALEWLPKYRVEFLAAVKRRLEADGHLVTIIHGQSPGSVAARQTGTTADFAEYRANKTLSARGNDVVYQPVLRLARRSDIVIVQQESSLLLNLLLAISAIRPRIGWAMWGHGEHFDLQNPNSDSPAAKLKHFETRRCDRFFAYTETSRTRAIEVGVAPEEITVVRNTTSAPNKDDASPEAKELATDLAGRYSHLGVMVSSLDQSKRIDFLQPALDRIHAEVAGFGFMVIGKGEFYEQMEEWASTRPWVHLLGTRFEADKVALASIASVTIHPGLAGLHVVDSFRHRAPMITTEPSIYTHELDYLVHGENGLMVPGSMTAVEYADVVVELLDDDEALEHLAKGCDAALPDLAVEASAGRFVAGVEMMLKNRSNTGKRTGVRR